MATEESDESRPSFTSFWKKTKQILQGNRVEFVQQARQSPPQPVVHSSESPEGRSDSSSSKPATASDKAKARRAQVRRAQIQHRQRKAEYVKQLELDVSHFRELIALTEAEAAELKKENSAMKAQLKLVGVTVSVTPDNPAPTASIEGIESQIDRLLASDQQPMEISTSQVPDQVGILPQQAQEVPEMFGDIDLDDVIVTLKKDDELRTPVFSVRPSSSDSNSKSSSMSRTSSLPTSVGSSELTEGQEAMAINFILSMEHICWDHFWLGDYPGHHHHSDEFKGHTLMASTFAMAHAPEEVYRGRKHISNASECGARRAMGMNPHLPAVFYEWPAPRIALTSLHGLASSLNPSDKEVTPVQAWFELADRYPKNVLLNPGLLSSLTCELNGVVKCLEFGAVMEREAFESVVSRILGPSLDEMLAETMIDEL